MANKEWSPLNAIVREDSPAKVPRYPVEPVREGLKFTVRNTGGLSAYDTVEWVTRPAKITNPMTGEDVFSIEEAEFPATWSANACALVAEKYFRYVEQSDGSLKRETSVADMIRRITETISRWGVQAGYFANEEHAGDFAHGLAYALLHQKVAFNSPVWFNVGTKRGRLNEEQCSACFINSLDDDMQSILELGLTEGKLYKGGSGSGVNYSKLRSSRESLSGGGFASGPVPFIQKDDFNAGAIKSGGTTRRAAKMAILDVDHGDIVEFIKSKAKGEKAAHVLIDSGVFTGDFRDRWGAYAMVPFQNANHSVRVTDDFMRAVETNGPWDLLARDGNVLETVDAKDLWNMICQAAWECGDPGLQFDTTINKWHTSPVAGRINSSNPCSEYMYLDDSACNLASLNLLRFYTDGQFDTRDFTHTIDLVITAMDIIVGAAGYPTEKIAENSDKYRPLGLGFSNLGAFLMAQGIPYDSVEGRAQAGAITAIISGQGYKRSAELAEAVGPFAGYSPNRASMLSVMGMHAQAVQDIAAAQPLSRALKGFASQVWDDCIRQGEEHGYRNGQISVIAPAGTISFMMDCDTTGIEPDLSLKKTKKLVGGGTISIVNQQVSRALRALGYENAEADRIVAYVDTCGSLSGSSLKPEHVPVFDTSLADPVSGRFIEPIAHVKMMGAVQPFVSGAISKTVNMPADSTVEDVSDIYLQAWRHGLKAVALYRDGCKRTQPLAAANAVESEVAPPQLQTRMKLPKDCVAHRHSFQIGQQDGYLHVGMYPDGKPGELFITMAKEGSTVSGLMDAIGMLTSIALQYGVPLDVLVEKFSYTQFEPSGFTSNEDVRFAKSPLDYIFRYLGTQYIRDEDEVSLVPPEVVEELPEKESYAYVEGVTCSRCGNNTLQRAGSCLTCSTCGWSEGCG